MLTRSARAALAMQRRRLDVSRPIDYLTMARQLWHRFALNIDMPRSEIAYRIANATHAAMKRRYKHASPSIRDREQRRWGHAMTQLAPSLR